MREGTVLPIAEELKRLRIEHGLSQEELAEQAGVSKRTVENAEAGKPVYVRTMSEIATALHVPIKTLIAAAAAAASPEPETTHTMPHATGGAAPPLPSLLIGRDDAIRDLTRRLIADADSRDRMPTQTLTAVRGWPGVGKTTLARALAHSPAIAEAFPSGVLWTSLGPSPVILAELKAWGRALKDPDLSSAETVAEASSRLAALLREQSMLLIVDDAWEPNHVAPFSVGGRHCAMLVTTRSSHVAESLSPTPDDIFHLDILSESDSLALLRTLAPRVVEAYPSECRQLVRELEGLPLALQVAGRLLRAEQARGWSVPQLLQELRADKKRLLTAQAPADMAPAPGQVSPTVTALLRRSTDCLDPVVRKRFARLAPFAPRPAVFELGDMMFVWQVDEAEARRIVNILVDRGLIEPFGGGDYQIHQILVEHAKTLLAKR